MELVTWKVKDAVKPTFKTTFWKKFRTTKCKNKTNEFIITTIKSKLLSVNITKFIHAIKIAGATIWNFKSL